MAGSVNKVILIGNLGKDPEVRSTQDGRKIVNLTVATSENWKDKMSGERREKTEWHKVVIFNDRLGEVAEKLIEVIQVAKRSRADIRSVENAVAQLVACRPLELPVGVAAAIRKLDRSRGPVCHG